MAQQPGDHVDREAIADESTGTVLKESPVLALDLLAAGGGVAVDVGALELAVLPQPRDGLLGLEEETNVLLDELQLELGGQGP
jgi:hypothetical protein